MPEDVSLLYRRLRNEDLEEIITNHDTDVRRVLLSGVQNSTEAWTFLWDGVPESIGGIIRQEDGSGIIWQLGSVEVKRHSRRFLVKAREIVRKWRRQYPVIHNFVGVKSTGAHRFLRWLGFVITDAPMTAAGDKAVKLYYFYWRRDSDVQS